MNDGPLSYKGVFLYQFLVLFPIMASIVGGSGSRSCRVRPPKWETSRSSSHTMPVRVNETKRLQSQYLELFRSRCAAARWPDIHRDHFDWWQFPIDDGSRPEFNLKSEADIAFLRSDAEWLDAYLESIRLVARAWGWDVDQRSFIAGNGVEISSSPLSGFWDKKDVRLAKIIRSLWLFEEKEYFESMQSFANLINAREYNNRGFFYGSMCLDEILHMRLPRR